MGEKLWPNGAWDMPQICDMGPIILLPFRRKACRGILSPFKNPTSSAGFEPANLGIRGQHATSAPPKPLYLPLVSVVSHHHLLCKITSHLLSTASLNNLHLL